MSKKTEERIAALQRLATNKACFDCRRPGLQSSVCFPFGIFVCTSCAGLHRQFPDHHVNTINMTTFSEKQADLLESNGNRKAASIFLAYHNDPATLPNETSPQATITAFIRDCFVHRRWVVAPNQPATKAAATPSSAPANHSATISPAGAIPGRRGAVEAPHAPAGVIPAMSTANARRGSALSPATSIPAASAAPTSAGRRNTVTASAAPNRTVGGGHPAPDFFAAGPAAGGSSLAGGSGTVDVFAAAPQQAAPAAAAAAPAAPADVSSIRFFADVQFPYGVSPSSLDSNLSTASKELAKAMASIILNHRLNASQFATVVGTATMVTARARAAREPTDPALMNQQQNQQRRSSVSAAASPIAPIPAPMGGPMQRPSAPAPTSMPVQAPTRGQADAFGGGADPFGPASVGEEADDDDVFGAPKVPPTRPAAAGPIEGRPMTVPAPVAAAAAPANDDFAADFGAQSSSLAAPAPVPAAIAQADPFADVAPPATTGRLSLGGGTAPGPAAGTTMYDLLQGNTAPAASLRRQPGGPGAGPVPTPYGAPYGAGAPGAGYGAAPGASLTMTGQYGGYAMQQQQQQQQQQAQQYGYPPQQQPQQQYGMGGYPQQQQQQQQPYGYPQQAPYGAPGGYNQQMPGNYMGGYPQQQQFQQPMQQSSQMQTLQPKKTAEQEAADKAFSDIAMPF